MVQWFRIQSARVNHTALKAAAATSAVAAVTLGHAGATAITVPTVTALSAADDSVSQLAAVGGEMLQQFGTGLVIVLLMAGASVIGVKSAFRGFNWGWKKLSGAVR
jgi:outer membrane receptor protein involved in Fe transport